MTPDRWEQINRLYYAALEVGNKERVHFLEEACSGDPDLRAEVESLLATHEQSGGFLGKPAMEEVARQLQEEPPSFIGRQLGPYQILGLLGAGGMGEVYRAGDTNLGRHVAIKILPDLFAGDPERLARFEREAKLLASLNHTNIATIHGLERAGEKRFLIMELVEGETLAQRIVKGPIPVDETLDICRQIAEGLEAAHEKGIVHRDLKPANVIFTPQGRIKILDFGLARALASEAAADPSHSSKITEAMTHPGIIMGTAAYMSPEQARGKVADKRADIWAFACVLYECLTGNQPFRGETITETMAKILETTPDWDALPPNTPSTIRSLLQRCLQKDPNRRLRDIGDARIEIVDPTSQPLAAEALPAAMPHRRWMLIAVAAVAAVVIFVTGVFVERSIRGTQPSPVMRSSIPLPTGTQLTRDRQGPIRTETALSPDGSCLVFSASTDGSESKSMLYRRAMGRAEASAIPGTEGARTPFFSSDGKWIGFCAKKKLYRVPSGGGIPTPLCDLPEDQPPMGASWGSDGRIIFGTTLQGPQRIPGDGGKPELITKIDSTKEAGHHLPCVQPGGKALVFTVMPYGLGATARVELLMLQTGGRRILIEDGADARYAPTDHLVFVRRGTLMAVPFDLNRLEPAGPAAPTIDGVMQAFNAASSDSNSAAGQYTFSESGPLVYASGGIFPDPEFQWYWIDRKGTAEPIEAFSKQPVGFRRISPDGKRIAYHTNGINQNIWVYDIDRGTSIKLTLDGHALFPIWTPDGSRIAFAWTRAGILNVWSKAAGGNGEMEQLTQSEFRQLPGSWSRDGKFLAVVEDNPSTSWDILVLGIEGKQLRRFLATQSQEVLPEFSPDGRWLAYVSDESGKNEVYARTFPAGDNVVMISNQGGQVPVWGPDGRELFYWNLDYTKLMKVDVMPGQELSAGTPRVLFEFAASSSNSIRSYDITPDGKRFLIRGRTQFAPTVVTQLNLVQNWFEELKRLVPGEKR
jgi:serine/threonine-protein kinase